MTLLHKIGSKPIIAAVRKLSELNAAIESDVDNVFFMGGSVSEIVPAVTQVRNAGKHSFIHLDLVRGLSSTDKETIEFVADHIRADGIVTPKSHMVKAAKQAGLYGILHLFVIDSLAVDNGLKMIDQLEPDGIELMPGVIPKVIETYAAASDTIPIIASGLIRTVDEARTALNAGATSLSVSETALWRKSFQDFFPEGI